MNKAMIGLFFVAGCAQSSVLDMASDTIQISTSAAPVCGQAGAQEVAAKRAAIETLNRNFDRYVILDGNYQNDVQVVGRTPYTANTYSSGSITGHGNTGTYTGRSTTHLSGGLPILGGGHNQSFIIKMFRNGDPAGAKAISAKNVLGPNWQREIKASKNGTC